MKKYFLFLLAVVVHFTSIAQLNITFKSKLPFPGKVLSNIWGYAAGGKEYALVGHSQGMSVVEVTDPAIPLELFQAPGPNSIWREVRSKGTYAFVTTEGGGGLQIVNLLYLPDSIQYKNWTGDGAIAGQLNSVHALQVDGNFLYLYGSNLFSGAPLIIDVTDPWNPVYVNKYVNPTAAYVHDGIVRNDTGYFGHINAGFFSVVNITDKLNPVTLATQNTTNNFTHNTWLSDNNKILFTTDEVNNSFLTSYNVSDPGNIFELDRIQHNPGSNSVVHNTYILNDYAVSSWYKDGVVIIDAARPDNLVITGDYDTSPLSGAGMEGCWGVYTFLPSGNLLCSDIQEGMYVLAPTYVRGCYLEGTVTSLSTGNPIVGAMVKLLTTTINTTSNLTGAYKTGIAASGGYSVEFSAPGFVSDTLSANLTNGVLTVLNAQLASLNPVSFGGKVIEKNSGLPVTNANVRIENSNYQYDLLTDGAGNFSVSSVFAGTYEVGAGKWGYVTNCFSQYLDSTSTNILIELDSGWYDDFTFNFGWTVVNSANAGMWVRGKPNGTFYNSTPANPGNDMAADCFGYAFISGNSGVDCCDDDVDDGTTILTSPVFNLSAYTDPYLSYYRWFFNAGGFGTPNDTLIIQLDNGSTIVIVDTVSAAGTGNSSWIPNSLRIADFITPTATMQVIVIASDMPASGHLVEAGFDKFRITDNGVPPIVDFTASAVSVCVYDSIDGGTIQFTDSSTGANSYQWTFSGGSPATDTMPSVAVTYYNAGTFNVELTVTNSFGSVTLVKNNYVTVTSCTGIDESKAEDIGLMAYPNPFYGALHITYALPVAVKNAKLSVFDVTGRLVAEVKVNDYKGTVSLEGELGNGVYYVKLTSGNKIGRTVKIIKL